MAPPAGPLGLGSRLMATVAAEGVGFDIGCRNVDGFSVDPRKVAGGTFDGFSWVVDSHQALAMLCETGVRFEGEGAVHVRR
jgi:hypothetical protein